MVYIMDEQLSVLWSLSNESSPYVNPLPVSVWGNTQQSFTVTE